MVNVELDHVLLDFYPELLAKGQQALGLLRMVAPWPILIKIHIYTIGGGHLVNPNI
jgi:hypothetical protein